MWTGEGGLGGKEIGEPAEGEIYDDATNDPVNLHLEEFCFLAMVACVLYLDLAFGFGSRLGWSSHVVSSHTQPGS